LHIEYLFIRLTVMLDLESEIREFVSLGLLKLRKRARLEVEVGNKYIATHMTHDDTHTHYTRAHVERGCLRCAPQSKNTTNRMCMCAAAILMHALVLVVPSDGSDPATRICTWHLAWTSFI